MCERLTTLLGMTMARKHQILMCFHEGIAEGPKTALSGFDMTLDACRGVLHRTTPDQTHPNAIFALVDDSKRAGHPKYLVAVWRKNGEMLLRLTLKNGVIVNPPERVETPSETPEPVKRKVMYRGGKPKAA